MATLVRHDSNSTRYSWLWVSHISPKNSKWLQENLTDMDVMVKAMIKLINEDADSFARRAEMYYKKRPELMKHVEEFYRAYRALAERYDQATGALRQAHRTISEEFPNQMPSMSEESPSSQEVEPRTPEMQIPLRAPFDPDDLHKDALGVSPQLFTVKRNGTHPDEISSSRKGLKQFNDLFASCDSAHRASFPDGKVRKGLSFESPDAKGKEDDIMKLQQEISKLLAESQSLKQQVSSESQRANNAESESQSLKDTISCLRSEKDAALLQYSVSTERFLALESELSKAHTELKKLSDYMVMEVEKLNCAESRNNTMQSELEILNQKIGVQEQELAQRRKEMEIFHSSLQDESAKRKQAEDDLCTIEKEYTKSQEEVRRMALEMRAANDRLSEFKEVKLNLEDTVCELKKEVAKLTEQKQFSELLIEELHGNIDSLGDSKRKIEREIQALTSTISEMNTAKDVALLQHQQCIEEVSDLESKLTKAQSEREKIELKVQMLVQELEQKGEEADAVRAQLQDEHFNHMQKEAALLAMEDLHSQSQEEAKRLAQDLAQSNKKLGDLEHKNFKLYNMLQEHERMISELNSKNDASLLQHQKSLERASCLEAQLLVAQLETEKIVKKAEKSSKRVSYLESQLSVAHSETEKIVKKAQLLEQELEHKNKEVGNLQSKLQKEGQKCIRAETAFLRVEHLHLQSQEEAKTLAQNLETLSKKLGEVENERLDLQNISRELKSSISEMNSEKDAVLLQQEQSSERVSCLEAQLFGIQSELEKNQQKVQLLEQDLKHKKEEVNVLQNNLEEESQKRMHVEAELTMAKNLLSKSQEEVGRLAMDLESLNKKFSDVQDSKLVVEELSCELRNAISVLNAEKEAALVQQRLSFEKVSDLNSEVSKIQLELEKTENKLQMLEQEIVQKNGMVEFLQSSLQEEGKKRVQAENLYSQSQQEVNRLALEVGTLNRKLNEVENLSSELKNTILLLNSEKDTTHLKHKQSLVRTSDLESELSEVQAELKNAEQKVQMLAKELKQKREEVTSLQISLEDEAQKRTEGEEALLVMTNEHSNSQEEVNRLDIEISMLNRKLHEVENVSSELKKTILLLNSEKGTALLQQKESLVRVSNLEIKLSEVQAELESSEQKGQMLDKELKLKREEVDALQTSLKDEARKHIEGEAALLMMTNLHSQSQEEVSMLVLDIERLNGKLNEMENSKMDLENMISKHAEDNRILGEKNLSSESVIRGLHDELDMLKEMKVNLKNEVGLQISENEVLQQQLTHQIKDKEILGNQYCSLEIEMEALNRRAATLQQVLEEKVCGMEKLSDEFSILKKSFSNAIAEMEALKETVKELEDSESSLKHDVSLHSSEKDALALELHVLNKKYADVSEQKSMLETSFSNVNSELAELRMKLEDSEELSQSYLANNSAILAEKDNILSQLERTTLSMKSLEDEHGDLGDKHSSLLAEKDLLYSQLRNLQDQLEIRNEQHEALLRLHQIQINDFEVTVSSLREKICHMDQMLDQEQQECAYASISALILNNCLADVKDKNFTLLDECRKFIEATHSAEVLIARLEEEAKNEEEEKKALLNHNKNLRDWISQQIKILNICEHLARPGVVHDEIMLQTLSRETFNHVKHKEESEHRNVFMEAELSVLGTILTQIVFDSRDLHCQKCELEKEVETGAAKLLLLQNKNHELIKLNEQLGQRLLQGSEREEKLKIELNTGIAQLMQKDDKLRKADEKNQSLQETNQELCRVLRDLEASVEDAKGVKGELEKIITTLTEQVAERDNDFLLLCEAKVALQGEVDINKQKEKSLMSTLEMVTAEAEQHEKEIVSLVSDMITCSVNVMIYEEHLLELMMDCEALEIRMITEREMLMKEISSRNAYVDDLHKRIASMGGENAKLKTEMSISQQFVASLSDQLAMLEEGTLLLSEFNKEGKLEFVQEDRRGSESQDKSSCVLELQSLIARVEALRVVILDAKDRQDKEFTESAAKLEAANVEIEDLRTRKISWIERKEQNMDDDDRQKYDADNSKGKQVQIMKDIELDQVSTCSRYGTGATVYPLGGDANAELDDEMLQLWETAEKDCKNQTAKSSSSEHDIQAVEEVKSEYPSFELARGRDLGIDRLEMSTASLEPQQLWSKNVLEKLATDAQGLLIIQASIEEVKQKTEGTLKGKSPTSSEYSSVRAQLEEIEGSVLEQIDFNNSLTKKAENYPAFEVNADLEGYSSRRRISEQVQKGSEKVARLDLELQKIQYVLLKLEEEYEFKRVKVSDKRSRLLLRDYVYARKDKNDAAQKKKSRVPFCGCVRPKTRTEP